MRVSLGTSARSIRSIRQPVDAPDAETANTVHRQAHGLVADEIYPVSEHS